MKRIGRTGLGVPGMLGAVIVLMLSLVGPESGAAGGAVPHRVASDLRTRDPQASVQARRVFAMLAGLENDARAGHTTHTVIGEHVELQNERYNEAYGDYKGTKQPGYYYRKPADITGKLPGFVEVDLGPGYGQSGWGVGEARSYSRGLWPACSPYWGYTDDAVDLAVGVWKGLPRAADGSYNPSGTHQDCASGSTVTLPHNGGEPAGIVGMSFHEPYPGSTVKGFAQTLCRNSPAAEDPDWFRRVVTPGTTEHRDLLYDLSFLADHLGYLAAQGVPVLLRPYHEMNVTSCQGGFWWAAQSPALYRKLWRMTYDYLVGARGLHNLLFVWSPNAWDGRYATDPQAYYPGAAYVDMVGVDDYSDSPGKPFQGERHWTGTWYRGLEAYDKPRVMAESFQVPLNSRQHTTLDSTPWVLWNIWGDGLTSRNSTADVRRTYDSTRIVTGSGQQGDITFTWRSLRNP